MPLTFYDFLYEFKAPVLALNIVLLLPYHLIFLKKLGFAFGEIIEVANAKPNFILEYFIRFIVFVQRPLDFKVAKVVTQSIMDRISTFDWQSYRITQIGIFI